MCLHFYNNVCLFPPSLSHTHSHNQHRCPLCRAPFNRQDVIGVNKLIKAKKKQEKKNNKKRKREKMTVKGEPAAKVAALLEGLSEMKDDEQAVVFFQYTKFLNIVQEILTKRGYTTSRIDGTMSANRRFESQRVFKSGGTRVMLISLRAGGVGLNLTSANHVFMMDMWWNQACEEQAWDRVYRLGQTKPVRIVRYIVKDSIEEGFLKLAFQEYNRKGVTKIEEERFEND